MKQLIRITESDIHRMVRNTVNRILKEQDDSMILQLVAQGLIEKRHVEARDGENTCEVDLDDDTIAIVVFNVRSYPVKKRGWVSNDYDVPDDPDEIIDNYDVEVVEILLEDETSIQDNGIVYNALMEVIEMDYDDDEIPYLDDLESEKEW